MEDLQLWGWCDDVPGNGHTPSVSVVNSDEHSPWLQVELNADSHCVCNVWSMSARMCVCVGVVREFVLADCSAVWRLVSPLDRVLYLSLRLFLSVLIKLV